MCNCRKNKKEICLLKLQFINYVNNNMLKETNKALELLSTINCENLELVKKELQKIVGDEEKEDIIITQTVEGIGILSNIDCDTNFNDCKKDCEKIEINANNKNKCLSKCNSDYEKCKKPTTNNNNEPSTKRVCNITEYEKCLNNKCNDKTGTDLKNCVSKCNYKYNKCQ